MSLYHQTSFFNLTWQSTYHLPFNKRLILGRRWTGRIRSSCRLWRPHSGLVWQIFKNAWKRGFVWSHLTSISLVFSKKLTNGGYAFIKSGAWNSTRNLHKSLSVLNRNRSKKKWCLKYSYHFLNNANTCMCISHHDLTQKNKVFIATLKNSLNLIQYP